MPAPRPGPQVDRIVFPLACAAFASSAALRLVDPMLPALAADFHTTVGGAAVAVTATGLAYGLLQLLFGPLGDHYGKLRVITFACLASTLGAALGAPVVDHFGAQWLFLAAAPMLPLTGFVLASHIKARHRALKLAARGGAG